MIASETTQAALEQQTDDLAREVGRLRRRAEPESTLAHLADRMAGSVETIDAIIRPTASDLHRAGVPAQRALEHVDRARARMRALLGERRPA